MQPKDDFNSRQMLRRLKEARKADPNWESAIRKAAQAKAVYAKDDPCEGKVVIKRVQAPKRSK